MKIEKKYIILILFILFAIIVFTIFFINNKNKQKEQIDNDTLNDIYINNEEDSSDTTTATVSDNNQITQEDIDAFYDYAIEEQSKYEDDISNILTNTDYDEDGNPIYFSDYMESDYDVSFADMETYLIENPSSLSPDLYTNPIGPEIVTMIDFAVTHYCIDNQLTETFYSIDVIDDVSNMIFTFSVSSDNTDIILTVDCVNYKTRIDNIIRQ